MSTLRFYVCIYFVPQKKQPKYQNFVKGGDNSGTKEVSFVAVYSTMGIVNRANVYAYFLFKNLNNKNQ